MGTSTGDEAGKSSFALVAGLVAVVLVLHLPGLSWGFLADDYGHQVVLRGLVEHPTLKPWSLYSFGELPPPGSELFETVCPSWWTSPDWMVSFFRPVTSLSLWLDSALFGGNALGYHVTGLVLYAALLALAFALYRELGLSRGVASGALLLFGVQSGSFLVVAWIANRNTLLEALFSVAAVLAVARGARRARATRPSRAGGLALGLALALLAALSKESGVGAFALVAAYLVLAARRESSVANVRFARAGAAVCAALAVAFLAFLLLAGHGARTPFYPVPWSDPVGYGVRVLTAIPLAALALVTPIASDIFFVAPRLLWPACALGLLLGVPLARAMQRTLRAEPAAPFLAFWLAGTFLLRASAPMGDRLLFVPSVGAAALFAMFLARAPRPSWKAVRREPLVRWAALVLFGAGLFSAYDVLSRGIFFRAICAHARAVVVQADVGPPALGRRDVVFLQSPSAMAVLTPLSTWVIERPDDPDVRIWALQLGRRGLHLTREGERELTVRSLDAPFLVEPFERVFVSSDAPPVVGQRWRTAAFEVEALEVEGLGVRTLRLVFERSLDDPALRLLVDDGERMVRLAPPAIGAGVEIAPATALMPFAP